MTELKPMSPYERGSEKWLDEPIYLTELRSRLGAIGVHVKDPTIYRWARSGKIPTTKLGRYRTTVRAVLAALRPAEAA
jgi:hypothetical protein